MTRGMINHLQNADRVVWCITLRVPDCLGYVYGIQPIAMKLEVG